LVFSERTSLERGSDVDDTMVSWPTTSGSIRILYTMGLIIPGKILKVL
jgi:hypothetical protein